MHEDRSDGQVESRLAESEARYRAVIENASDMVQSCLPDGRFEFVNPAWLDKLGYTADEVRDLTVWDIIHPDSIEHCRDLFHQAVQGESVDHVRAAFVTKAGEMVPVEGNATSRFMGGEVVATHSFFRDISERLRAEELEHRNAELEREQVARYLEKMAALGKLAAGLAHELNNPAAAAQRASGQLAASLARGESALAELHSFGIDGDAWRAVGDVLAVIEPLAPGQLGPLATSEAEDVVLEWLEAQGVEDGWELAPLLVRDGILPGHLAQLADVVPAPALGALLWWVGESRSARDLAGVVADSAGRISELVAAVKSYTFMDRAAEQEVDVHEGIESTLVILAHKLRHVEVRRDYGTDLPSVRAFGSGLNQVWTNILDNAADVLPEDGTITIATRSVAGGVEVAIEDNGPGIPQEHQTRVFEPFFSTKAQGKGTGLGLDTVWRIVTEDHGGEIVVESVPGRTVFRTTLPVAPSA